MGRFGCLVKGFLSSDSCTRHDATPNKSRASEVGDKALECGRRLFLLKSSFFS